MGSLVNDAISQDELAACLVASHDPTIEKPFRQVLVMVLSDAPVDAAEARAKFERFGMQIATKAVQSCDVSIASLAGPEAERSFQLYGGWVGEKIMTDAMSRLGTF